MRNKHIIISILIFAFILSCLPINIFAAGNAKTTNTANLRSGPGIYHNVIQTLQGGTELTIIGKELGWFKVQVGGTTGYISETLVTITDASLAATYNTVSSNYEKLASYTTRFSASDLNRNHNMELSGTKNSIIVKPGEVFSFNKNTGNSTTTANGWRESIVIVNKERVRGIGGGICQTSSTIYSAVKQIKGLTILERHPHSLPVGYVPVENEAMVNYGTADFKFRNDLGYNIYVEVKISHSSGSLTATVYKVNAQTTATPAPSPTPTPEPPKPKDTPADVKAAYIANMKTVMNNPKTLLKTVQSELSDADVSYIEMSFTIEDIDKDGKYDLLLHYDIHTNSGLVNRYNLLYSYNTQNMYLVKTYLAGTKDYDSMKTAPYRNISTNALTWFYVDFNNGTATEIQPGFKNGTVHSLNNFVNNFIEFKTNKTVLSYDEVISFEKSQLYKPNTTASVSVDGQYIGYNLPPQTINDRLYIEMRSLFESLGYTIAYDSTTRRTVISSGNDEFILESGYQSQSIIHVRDGIQESIAVDIPIKLVSDRTMFPLRMAGELLGYEVSWDNNSFTAYLAKSAAPIVNEDPTDVEYGVVYDGRQKPKATAENETVEVTEAPEIDETTEPVVEPSDNVSVETIEIGDAFSEISIIGEGSQPTIDEAGTNTNG